MCTLRHDQVIPLCWQGKWRLLPVMLHTIAQGAELARPDAEEMGERAHPVAMSKPRRSACTAQ